MDMKLEVVVVPVSDVDRAKNFYKRLGFREDIDLAGANGFRVVQLTPPGSPCSIIFGKGITPARPGSLDRLVLVVHDIEAARDDLRSHGVEASFTTRRWPRRRLHRGHRVACPRTGSSAPFLRLLCLVQRSRRQRLALAGDHRAAPRPGGRRGSRTAPARNVRASRLVRGGCATARLVGLVRGVHGRSRPREHAGGGLRGRWSLHGGSQARRRLACLSDQVVVPRYLVSSPDGYVLSLPSLANRTKRGAFTILRDARRRSRGSDGGVNDWASPLGRR